jgi:hypothetical protein
MTEARLRISLKFDTAAMAENVSDGLWLLEDTPAVADRGI